MADKEPTMTVDDPISGEVDPTNAAAPDDAPAPGGAFAFDEQTLGRSSSVFDAGVDFIPPTPPPIAPLPEVGSDESMQVREMSNRERRRRVRLEARRVRRVVRHIELWSVLKFSLIFFFCMWLIFVLAGVLLWSFAESSGTLESIEDLVEKLFALKTENEFWSGGKIFRGYAIGISALAIAGVTFTVLIAALYNLISDLTGGIRVTVIEEESARFTPPRRRQR